MPKSNLMPSPREALTQGEAGAPALESRFRAICLVAAPLLMGISTFFWEGGKVGMVGGTVQVYACFFWTLSYFAFYQRIRPALPRMALLILVVGVYASLGGNNWGVDGIYGAAFQALGATPEMTEGIIGAMGPFAPFILFMPGLCFPLNFILTAIVLGRVKALPIWAASLMALGAVLFPASRIPRIELLAHLSDLLMLVPMLWLGWSYWSGRKVHA